MHLFDSHLHIIAPKFPLIPNQGYLPPFFTIEDYLIRAKELNITGGAVVSGSFQGFDQTYLIAALKELGPTFVGVTQLPATTTDEEIVHLHQKGVRAIRFNCKRGGSETLEHLETFAKRVHEVAGWHTELYIDSCDLPALSKILEKLPSISIDHLGLSKEGFPHLLALVEKGAHVKATGFGRVNFDIASALQQIVQVNPNALMFGTDLPSTRAPRPFMPEDIQLIRDTFEEAIATKILYKNGIELYKIFSIS